MQKKIVYSILAYNEVLIIYNYIAQDSFSRAEKFMFKIVNKIDNLKLFSNIGIKIDENKYILVIDKNYLIRYKIEKNIIYILTIRNVTNLS